MSAPYQPAASKARRLQAEAREAAEVRDALTDPDVVALRVEQARTFVERLIWTGIILGLLFTMTNVQGFAASANGDKAGALGWFADWLLDPTVSVILLGVLFAERQTSRHEAHLDGWARATKWLLLAATYTMNTWHAWATHSGAGIVLHSVPVVAVFLGAEALTSCNVGLTEAIEKAARKAAKRREDKTREERETAAVPAEQPPAATVEPAPAQVAPRFSAVPNLSAASPAAAPFRPAVVREPVPAPARPATADRPAEHPETTEQTVSQDIPPSVPQDVSAPPRRTSPETSRPTVAERPAGRPTSTPAPRPARPSGKSSKRPARPLTNDQLADVIRNMTASNGGQPPTPYQVKAAHNVGHARASRVLDQLSTQPAASPAANGAATRKDGTR